MAGNLKDFATGTVATAPSPADSGTTLALQPGEGARMPATPFSATVHPPSEMPTLDTAEKVTVTAVSGDTLTIVRAQGETTAQDIEVGWRFSNTLFLENIPSTPGDVGAAAASHTHPVTDLTATGRTTSNYLRGDGTWATPTNTTYSEITTAEIDAGTASTLRTITGRRVQYIVDKVLAAVAAITDIVRRTDSSVSGASWLSSTVNTATDKAASPGSVKTYVDAAIAATKQALYPVGSLYFNADDSTNPATLLGFGTWAAYAEGRVPVGKAASGTFSTAGATMGAETHTLTIGEMPSHNHNVTVGDGGVNSGITRIQAGYVGGQGSQYGQKTVDHNGSGQAHNNIQPSIVVYIWRRTA